MILRSIFTTTCLMLLVGCSMTTAVRVTDTNPTPYGLPLYGHKPILIVTAQGAQVELIPNLDERYAVQMWAFLSANHTKLTLNENGTLASVDANLDSTAVISLLESLVDKIPEAPGAGGEIATGGAVAIYEFVFNGDGTVDLRPLVFDEIASSAPPRSRPSDNVDQDNGGSLGIGG